MYDFKGKVALITGGVSGIGLATAFGFARGGAKVAIVGRNPERGAKAAAELAAAGADALYVQADVGRPDDVERMVDETMRKFQRLDFAFNNAAVELIDGVKSIVDTKQEEFDEFIATNVSGLFNGMKREIPAILASAGKGAIVNMTSVAGLRPNANVGNIYGATRHAITGLTTNAARDWAPKGIRINAVLPGSILSRPERPRSPEVTERLTKLHPIGRMGLPAEVANAVLWLCSDQASFVVGALLNVDGGLSLT